MDNKNNKDLVKATISVKSLIVAWLSIPALYLIPFLLIYLPNYIKMKVSGEIESAFREAANLGQKIDVADIVKQEIYGGIPPIIISTVETLIGLLFFAWLIWAIGYTILHFKYKLQYDGSELYGRTWKKEIRIPLDKINNVFVEDSLWGKLFDYGTITIASSIGAISIKNVSGAKRFAKKLASETIEKGNNFTNL